MTHNPRNAKAFIAMMAAAGLGSISFGLAQTHTWHPYQAAALLAIAAVASRMKIKLPGLSGNMSVNLPFLLIAVAELNLIEALLVACVSTSVQCLPKDWLSLQLEQMFFNLATMSLATTLTWQVLHSSLFGIAGLGILLPLATATFFLGQTVPVSVIIALSSGGTLHKVWMGIAQLTFPYFVLSAGVASISMAASSKVGWQLPLLALPVMFGVYRSYQTYFQGGTATEKVTETPLARAASTGK